MRTGFSILKASLSFLAAIQSFDSMGNLKRSLNFLARSASICESRIFVGLDPSVEVGSSTGGAAGVSPVAGAEVVVVGALKIRCQ